MNIENAVAVVTGANRGIGKALVDALLSRGASRVYAAARSPEGVAVRDRVVPLRLDVTVREQVESAAAKARDATLLFNNAGTLGAYGLLTTPPEDLEKEFRTNFHGSLAVTKAFLPALLRAPGRAAVVNVLTVVSLASMPGLGGYSASKAAAFSMTQALRGELKPKGIAVHAVFPGPVDTDMAKAITLPKTSPEDVARAILDGVARGDEDICPDPMSRDVYAKWAASPKDVEHQFASM
jgi:NAD(P)-dependent dehydrogenase (short-subunit alcohol dehydrogenase family)